MWNDVLVSKMKIFFHHVGVFKTITGETEKGGRVKLNDNDTNLDA